MARSNNIAAGRHRETLQFQAFAAKPVMQFFWNGPYCGNDIADVTVRSGPPAIVAVERNDGVGLFHQLNSLRVVFSESVGPSLDKNDLVLRNLCTNLTYDLSAVGFSYDAIARAGDWNLEPLALGAACYEVKLLAAGITNAEGLELDGEFTGAFPTGNGAQGGDCVIRGDDAPAMCLVTYPGDANLDGRVSLIDLSALAAHYGQSGWDGRKGISMPAATSVSWT